MSYFSIDHLIVYAFLGITLFTGLRVGSSVKDIKEYAIGNKQFGTGALAITLLATYIGGWHILGFPNDVFADGLTHLIPELVCGVIICLLFIAWFIAPRLVQFNDSMTMGDLMRIFYGEYGQMITGGLGFIYNTSAIGIQIVFLGYIGNFLGIRSDWGIVLGTLILAVYTARGGIKAVVITDIIQFVAIVAAIPLLAHLITYQAGGIRQLLSSVSPDKLQLFDFGQDKSGAFSARYYRFPTLIVWMLFPGFPLSFPFVQRMLMARTQRQSREVYYIGTAFMVSFFLLLALVGLAALVLYPQADSREVMTLIINGLPAGVKGLTWAALLAVVMSTTDSFLHAAGISLTHDLIGPLLKRWGVTYDEYRMVRYAILFVSLMAIALALSSDSIVSMAIYGMDMSALLFTIPLIAGIVGLQTNARSFFIASLVTVLVFAFSQVFLDSELAVPLTIVANLLGFFGAHYAQYGNFVVHRELSDLQIGDSWHPPDPTHRGLYRFLPTPRKLLCYSREKVDLYGANPTTFALFMTFGCMVPLFMHGYTAPEAYTWLLGVRGVGALLCVGLLLQFQWPTKLLPYFPAYYHFALCYCLPFATTFLFLLGDSSVEYIVNITLSIMLLIVLVDWRSFVGLSVVGVASAFFVYHIALTKSASMDMDTGYTLCYALVFATLIGLLFARRKQQRFDNLAAQRARLSMDHQVTRDELFEATEEKLRFVSFLKKAGLEGLESVAHLSQELLVLSKKEGNEQFRVPLQRLTEQLVPMAFNMDRFVHRTAFFLTLDGVKKLPIEDFTQDLQKMENEAQQTLKIVLRTQQKALQCDIEKMKKVLCNSFSLLRAAASKATTVLLAIDDTYLVYPTNTVPSATTRKVAALRFAVTTMQLPPLAPVYTAQVDEEYTTKSITLMDMPLFSNARIVQAHYGYSGTMSQEGALTFVYVIPVNLREVRSKDMDTPQMQLGAKWPRADDTYPGAQAREKELLENVQARSKADLSLVKKAIDLIKDYHGPVRRRSGEPFYLHPVAVAQIVLDYDTEETTILGALLHDTVEDTPITLEQIALLFGQQVSSIVDGVTHMKSHRKTMYKVLLSQPENIHQLWEAKDKRILYVKLADRLHNMRTLQAKSRESQHRTAEETLLFFVPLAKYLGLMEAVQELKQRSFEVLKDA